MKQYKILFLIFFLTITQVSLAMEYQLIDVTEKEITVPSANTDCFKLLRRYFKDIGDKKIDFSLAKVPLTENNFTTLLSCIHDDTKIATLDNETLADIFFIGDFLETKEKYLTKIETQLVKELKNIIRNKTEIMNILRSRSIAKVNTAKSYYGELDLRCLNLVTIPADSIPNYTVKNIWLSGNYMATPNIGLLFTRYPILTSIGLQRNGISKLSKEMFTGIPFRVNSRIRIDLDNNPIQDFDLDCFNNLWGLEGMSLQMDGKNLSEKQIKTLKTRFERVQRKTLSIRFLLHTVHFVKFATIKSPLLGFTVALFSCHGKGFYKYLMPGLASLFLFLKYRYIIPDHDKKHYYKNKLFL